MDEQSNPTPGTQQTTGSTSASGAADESLGWNASASDTGGAGANTGERILSQLQAMIDQIATQAAPVAKQIGAKAAELAAAAADRAGPIAHKAADVTADASVKIAERSRELAADLRRELGNGDSGQAAGGETVGGPTGRTTTVLDGIDGPAEQAAKDDPAEGA